MRRPLLLLAAALSASFGACSQEGGATSAGPAPRDPIHLVVSGTDREMGLQQGKALAKEIREEVGPRLRARFRAVARDAKEAEFLESACRAYTAPTKPLLPRDVAEELAGIAEGSGVPDEDLLLLEVMRDGLRFHLDAPPLLEAAFASPPVEASGADGPVLVAAWDGAGGREAAGHVLVLERRPAKGSPSMVVTWPGGLGAAAGVSRAGVVAQCETPSAKEALSLRGVPFTIVLAAALRTAEDVETLVRGLAGRNGNRVLAAGRGDRGPVRLLGLLASAGPTSSAGFPSEHWIVVPAGPGAPDPRAATMDERLGGYPERPGAAEAVALAVSGRSPQAGAVIELRPDGITWHGAVDAMGKDLRPPIRFPFPSSPAK